LRLLIGSVRSGHSAATDTKREEDAQSLSGTPTVAGTFTVVISVREDPGAEPSSTPDGNPLTYPYGQPVCARTTEKFTLVVQPEPTPAYKAELTRAQKNESAALGDLDEGTQKPSRANRRLSGARF